MDPFRRRQGGGAAAPFAPVIDARAPIVHRAQVVKHARTPLAPWSVVCLLLLGAGCAGPGRLKAFAPALPGETWIVARDTALTRGIAPATAPAIVVRGAGAALQPSLAKTRVAVTVVGPIAR